MSTNLVLMSHIDRLELQVESPEPDSLPSLCPHVVTTIKKAIDSLKSCHKYLKFYNSLGFYCISGLKMESGVPHAAVCLDQESPQYMMCQAEPECGQNQLQLLDEHNFWFGKVF